MTQSARAAPGQFAFGAPMGPGQAVAVALAAASVAEMTREA